MWRERSVGRLLHLAQHLDRHLGLLVVQGQVLLLPPDQLMVPHLAQHLDQHLGLLVVLRQVLLVDQL
jgi:hypothetical protein